jgi:hypothetical protein
MTDPRTPDAYAPKVRAYLKASRKTLARLQNREPPLQVQQGFEEIDEALAALEAGEAISSDRALYLVMRAVELSTAESTGAPVSWPRALQNAGKA